MSFSAQFHKTMVPYKQNESDVYPYYFRFLESLTVKRRQAQEQLAEKAISDAKEEEVKAAAAAAAAAEAALNQNGPTSTSAPVTPATTPSGLREGEFES